MKPTWVRKGFLEKVISKLGILMILFALGVLYISFLGSHLAYQLSKGPLFEHPESFTRYKIRIREKEFIS